MAAPIDTLTIEGFKSIQSLQQFKLHNLNILIGANGAGKSNFVSFFSFLHDLVTQRLQLSIAQQGGADAYLFLGPKFTQRIRGEIHFWRNGYAFTLTPTVNNRMVFEDERIVDGNWTIDRSIGKGQTESLLKDQLNDSRNQRIAAYVWEAISSWTVYHFHDTSNTAAVKRQHTIRDYEKLRADASNLAAFLLHLQATYKPVYDLIRDTVRLVTPFFDDFKLRTRPSGQDVVIGLEWTQVHSDYPFHASQLSDGTLRFICLVTALLQPSLPATIIIDEPELGLHPYALTLLASLLKQAAQQTQVIVSTQSVLLLNHFEPEDVIVVDREDGQSRFRRLSSDDLKIWLEEDYSLGDLWQKNIYGGGPVHE